jgi:hypothetical protein
MEHPCHYCNKSHTCGGTCNKFRGFMAQLAGAAATAVDRSARESAEAIMESNRKRHLADPLYFDTDLSVATETISQD